MKLTISKGSIVSNPIIKDTDVFFIDNKGGESPLLVIGDINNENEHYYLSSDLAAFEEVLINGEGKYFKLYGGYVCLRNELLAIYSQIATQ